MAFPFPSVGLLSGDKAGSFAVPTLTQRVPATVNATAKDFRAANQSLAVDSKTVDRLCFELKTLAEDLRANSPLELFEDTDGDSELWNQYILFWRKRGLCGLLNVPWLLAECYVYKKIITILHRVPQVWGWDPFQVKKQASWWAAVKAATDHGESLLALSFGWAQFLHVFNFSLWGNRADLSLHADIDSASAAVALSNDNRLLVNGFPELWRYLSQTDNTSRRMDLVLDNAGIELFADLCLADWLVSSGCTDTVVLHCKAQPWFVSDVTRSDISWLLQAMTQLPPTGSGGKRPNDPLLALAGRWNRFLSTGKWRVAADPFWTTPFPFWHMPTVAPLLYQHLTKSRLIIFKGDLNYRKLLFDAEWDPATPFSEAIGPFTPAPLIALRTNKADVIAGLPQGMAPKLDREFPGQSWLISGEFAVAQFWQPCKLASAL